MLLSRNPNQVVFNPVAGVIENAGAFGNKLYEMSLRHQKELNRQNVLNMQQARDDEVKQNNALKALQDRQTQALKLAKEERDFNYKQAQDNRNFNLNLFNANTNAKAKEASTALKVQANDKARIKELEDINKRAKYINTLKGGLADTFNKERDTNIKALQDYKDITKAGGDIFELSKAYDKADLAVQTAQNALDTFNLANPKKALFSTLHSDSKNRELNALLQSELDKAQTNKDNIIAQMQEAEYNAIDLEAQAKKAEENALRAKDNYLNIEQKRESFAFERDKAVPDLDKTMEFFSDPYVSHGVDTNSDKKIASKLNLQLKFVELSKDYLLSPATKGKSGLVDWASYLIKNSADENEAQAFQNLLDIAAKNASKSLRDGRIFKSDGDTVESLLPKVGEMWTGDDKQLSKLGQRGLPTYVLDLAMQTLEDENAMKRWYPRQYEKARALQRELGIAQRTVIGGKGQYLDESQVKFF